MKTTALLSLLHLYKIRYPLHKSLSLLSVTNGQLRRFHCTSQTLDMSSSTHTLTLPQGQIKGIKKQALYGDLYYSFEGIPFAKPPLEELRFKAPQPAEPWEGVRDCTQPGNKPVQRQYLTGEVEGFEDCLYLNVYTKVLQSVKPLPVMVWIYGGGFVIGGAVPKKYGPDYFMREDIVLVEFNYRVDSLGFLSLCDPELEVPGNAGLKDQVLALKWVKKYISHFNGDSNNITVFGESAGGASVHYMMATEQTRGLFHKAIPMSGCILNYWANTPQHEMGYRLAKSYGYTGANVDKQVLEFLQSLTAKQLVDHLMLNEEERLNGLQFDFSPTVEPYVGPDCVVPKSPLEMARHNWSHEIPIMIGCTSDEGIFMYPQLKQFPHRMVEMQNNPCYLVPTAARKGRNSTELKRMGEKLWKLHVGKKAPNEDAIPNFMDYYSYRLFWHDVHRTVLGRLNYACAPTYLYRFNFDSRNFNFYRTRFCCGDPLRGTSHGDDIVYLLYQEAAWKLEPDSAEFKTIERMVGMWTAFAKVSDPNCAQIEPTIWKPLNKTHPNLALNISDEVKMIELPEKSKLDVWDTLYEKEDLY